MLKPGDSVPIHHLSTLTPLPSSIAPTEDAKQAAYEDVGPTKEQQKDGVVQPRIKKVVEEVRGRGSLGQSVPGVSDDDDH